MSQGLQQLGLQQKLTGIRAQADTMRGTFRTRLDQIRTQVWSRAGGLGGMGGGLLSRIKTGLPTPTTPIKTYSQGLAGGRLLNSPLRQRIRSGAQIYPQGPFPRGILNPSITPGTSMSVATRGRFPAMGGMGRTPVKSFQASSPTPVRTFEQSGSRTPIRTY